MLIYCPLDSSKQNAVKFESNAKMASFKKMSKKVVFKMNLILLKLNCLIKSVNTRTSCSLKSPVIRLFVEQFMRTHIKEKSKSAVPVLCEGNSPVTGEFPTQWASNGEKTSIWWRHHVSPNTSAGKCLVRISKRNADGAFTKHHYQILWNAVLKNIRTCNVNIATFLQTF